MVFSGTNSVDYCFICLQYNSLDVPIKCCTQILVGLYLNSNGRNYQKQKLIIIGQSMVPLHWNSLFVRILLCTVHWARNLEKHQKRCHFEITSLLGLEHHISYIY